MMVGNEGLEPPLTLFIIKRLCNYMLRRCYNFCQPNLAEITLSMSIERAARL